MVKQMFPFSKRSWQTEHIRKKIKDAFLKSKQLLIYVFLNVLHDVRSMIRAEEFSEQFGHGAIKLLLVFQHIVPGTVGTQTKSKMDQKSRNCFSVFCWQYWRLAGDGERAKSTAMRKRLRKDRCRYEGLKPFFFF